MTTTQAPTTKEPKKARRVFDAAYKLQVAKMIREQGVNLNKGLIQVQVQQEFQWMLSGWMVNRARCSA